MTRIRAIFLAIALLSSCALRAQTHDGWYADFDKAAAAAQAQGKDLLVDFTGSDWCGWCTRLKEEVFDHEEFSTQVVEHFVLVALDFPNSDAAKAMVPNPERNRELQREYEVQGFPTILLMTSDGVVYGQTGYRQGGPTAYLEHLESLRENGKGALALLEEFEGATGAKRAQVIEKTIAMLYSLGSSSAVASSLSPIVRSAVESKPGQPEYGLRLEALKALFAAGSTDDDLRRLAAKLDPRNEQGVLERAVLARCGIVRSEEDLEDAVRAVDQFDALGRVKDNEVAAMLYANAAWWLHKYLEKPAEAQAYARKLQAIAGNDSRFTRLYDEVLGKE